MPRPEYTTFLLPWNSSFPSKKTTPSITNDPGLPGVYAIRPRRLPLAFRTWQSYAEFGKRYCVPFDRSSYVLLSNCPGKLPVVHDVLFGPGFALSYQ